MATKKKQPSTTTKSKPAPRAQSKPRLENLAARPTTFDDEADDQLVDNSGLFRVTSSIAQAQTGHDEEQSMRFPSESLVMQAQREGFREDGVTMDDVIEESKLVDEAGEAERQQRLRTLAARAQQLRNRRR